MSNSTPSKKRVAALYDRVSTMMQASEGFSLESQVEDMTAFCHRKGWKIYKVYEDAGYSARLGNRPALQAMLDDVRTGKVDVVVVYDLSRFFRKLETLLSTLKILRDYGVEFISIKENIDFTQKWGKMILNILGTLAEIYIDDLSELTSRGKKQRSKSGLFNGSIPTGYCNGRCHACTDSNGPGFCPRVGTPPRGDGRVPVPHPIEAPAVQQAFKWYATGNFSDADIAYKLNRMSITINDQVFTPRPKRKRGDKYRYTRPQVFTHENIRDMMKRIFYTGQVAYFGGKGVAEERKKFKKAQFVEDGQHEALISTDLFETVQATRKLRRYTPNRAGNKENRVYPLSGLLFTWPHRSKMRGTPNGSGDRLYRDTANIGRSRMDDSPAGQPNVLAEIVEPQVLAILQTIALPGDWRQRIMAYLVAGDDEGLADIERKRRQLNTQFEHLNYLLTENNITLDDYERQKAQLTQELDHLLLPHDLSDQTVEPLLANPARLLTNLSLAEQKYLFRTVFAKIYVEGEQVVRLVVNPAFLEHFSDPRIVSPLDDVKQ